MREILFHGKRLEDGAWVEGYYAKAADMLDDEEVHIIFNPELELFPRSEFGTFDEIDPDTLGQYTGMTEFVVTDPSVSGRLFEGDIVEVWTNRRPRTEYNPVSQYDGRCKVRATIVFKDGCWQLDYDNAYNHKLEELCGKEDRARTVRGAPNLFRYGYHRDKENEDWYREHNKRYVFDDIVCIGNIHDNPELLEE